MRSRRLQRGIRLFDHPVLDWGSRIHPALPALFWGPLAAATLIWGAAGIDSAWAAVGWFVGGFAAWLVVEYAIHRWFFHLRPRSVWLRRMFYYVHEHHHRYQERDRLLAPPLMSLSIGAALGAAAHFTIGHWVGTAQTAVFLSGLAIGYLAYDYTHFFIHFAKPRTRWGRFVRRCHLEHHFRSPDRWFCISWPWLDYLFRTHGGRRRERSRGPTTAASADADRAHAAEPLHPDAWDAEYLPPMVREYEARKNATSSRQ